MEGWNYFNYFTEIEEYFWKKRGAHLLVSPLDWAIMETWHKAGVPIEAVLKGIDRAFESYGRSRRGAGKPLKSMAYCTDAVIEAAQENLEAAAGSHREGPRTKTQEPFSRKELREYFTKNLERIKKSSSREEAANPALADRLREIADSLPGCAAILDTPGQLDIEDLERRLTVLEEKLLATLTSYASEKVMLKIRREADRQLAAYRRKMRAEQLALVEKQYMQKRLLEEFDLPRLSLYYCF